MRLGTRGSALALAQAHAVAGMLRGDVEVVTITTTGDRDRAALDKQKWVAELELALLDGEIDLAVHSAKDVPGEVAEGTALVSAPGAREDARDALCGAGSLTELREGAKVGTSSLRRAAQLRAVRPDLEVAELRGNVDTRLRKLADEDYDAIVLAAAGLRRLGREAAIGGLLDELVPAPGQGTLTLQARSGEDAVRDAAAAIDDPAASATLRAERALVVGVGATCHTPVGAHAILDSGTLVISSFVGLPDGSEWLRDEVQGPAAHPEALGAEAARRLLSAGAQDLLDRAAAADPDPGSASGPAEA